LIEEIRASSSLAIASPVQGRRALLLCVLSTVLQSGRKLAQGPFVLNFFDNQNPPEIIASLKALAPEADHHGEFASL
jgi:hypothetical protein